MTVVALLLPLASSGMAMEVVTVAFPQGRLPIGVSLDCQFVIQGITNTAFDKRAVPNNPYTWAGVADFVLVRDGVRVADVLFDQRSILFRTNDGFAGSFSWFGRVYSYAKNEVAWVEPGKYTMLLGVLDKTTYGGGQFSFTAESEPFELVGEIPSLVIRAYPDGRIWAYASGTPGAIYSLFGSSNLGGSWTLVQQFTIPVAGMKAVVVGATGSQGGMCFFHLKKEE